MISLPVREPMAASALILSTNQEDTMHTPTPWTIGPSSNPQNGMRWRDLLAKSYNGEDMYVGEALKDNAALIVKAVNSYEAMKEALQTIIYACESGHLGECSVAVEWYPVAKQALALAEGKEQP